MDQTFARLFGLLLLASSMFLPSSLSAYDLMSAQSTPLPPSSCQSRGCLLGSEAFAQGRYAEAGSILERGLWSSDLSDIALDEYTDMLLLAAVAREREGSLLRAANHYDHLSRLLDSGTQFFAFRALTALLEAPSTEDGRLEQLERRGALSVPYPGIHLLRLRYTFTVDGTLPKRRSLVRSLADGETEEICAWLGEILSESEIEKSRAEGARNAAYGACLDLPDGVEKAVLFPDNPSDSAHLERAERLYRRVQFEEALAELKRIDFDDLDTETSCRARFRLGRTLYRLDRYSDAAKSYEKVVEGCHKSETTDPRIRSLYALGRRHFHLDHLARSKSYFEQILNDYPERSHVDDALMYLGRIARRRGETKREEKLLRRALENHPSGDMVHEFAWERLEPLYKAKKYEDFLEQLDALSLPERDDQYFSQGRLGYFRGAAENTLGRDAKALESWKEVWTSYPFSFYGYLAYAALVESGVEPPELLTESARKPPGWFYDPEWDGRVVRQLSSLGLDEYAADFESGRLGKRRETDAQISEEDYWRLAYLYHRAGRYERSHNIPRLRISGRPWATPETGRLTRWRIAFPSPYLGRIAQAIRDEQDGAGGARVPKELALAIIREESSFVEDIVSWAGAVGLMQLMPSTARHHDDDIEGEATVERLQTSEVNIRVGVDHLHLLAERLDSHPAVMVAAYNAGLGAVGGWLSDGESEDLALWVEDIPYKQTRNYAKRVIGSYAAYQQLDGARRLDMTVANAPPD